LVFLRRFPALGSTELIAFVLIHKTYPLQAIGFSSARIPRNGITQVIPLFPTKTTTPSGADLLRLFANARL
jgi:hypothetical protein